ncbi:dTDP-glucose 4,6-dehydratase 2 [Diplogelasinospora grovesii]|uniref:dTDP-glucose 4,6-dehydratase 2 n=1 Tax=Diplogelasinospora grovesii TaxID=303347 RepID=A0AAN6MY00_9PEZI|nr:dTDP-glucose 4,6-dehydratase 2 [Diplogelasinospora grovesii]
MRILVTGGCGFIGSALVLHLVLDLGHDVLTLDALTYAANPASLKPLDGHSRHRLVHGDICNPELAAELFANFRPEAVIHLAAESHVDRSITGPAAFIWTNVLGTQVMLEAARAYYMAELTGPEKENFRLLHVSTDEVYGSLPLGDGFFTEQSCYNPRSPYSASKAASDHLARAWHHTYGLPVVVTNCSNNYGPRQFPEKLIPLQILNAISGKALAVYGDGLNERDWIHVEDHARALVATLEKGRPGETYLLGGRSVRSNISVVQTICAILDRLRPDGGPHARLIGFVADRPGHDRRYAIDPGKAETELGWHPSRSFEDGLEDTVRWYVENPDWWRPIREGRYAGERLGLTA